jgi:hypothetical protein
MSERPIDRFRVNDYVGPPIWGFRLIDGAGAKVGDRFFYDDDLFTARDGKPYRSHYVVEIRDGRLACCWADRGAMPRRRFAGFIR